MLRSQTLEQRHFIQFSVCTATLLCVAAAFSQQSASPSTSSTTSAPTATPPVDGQTGASGSSTAAVQNTAAGSSTAAPVAGSTTSAAASNGSDYSAALSSFDSKKFIKYGVTAGFAVNVQVEAARQKATAITTMPYLMLVPAYWVLGDVQADYCSTAYGDDSAAALSAAKAYATAKAEDAMSAGEKIAYNAIQTPRAVDIDKDAGEKSPKTKEGWIKKKTGWNITKGGKCGLTHLGVFIGKPLSFDANAAASDGDTPSKQTVTGVAAFGIGYLPNANVTLLLGLSYDSITVQGVAAMGDTPATPESLKNFWTPMIGFGGNVDLLTALFK